MEQRPLRLGDMVDDYCTRERRVTNHVIVVLAEDAIRQTRCTTCDSEHPYKGGKEPRLRKKTAAPSLYEQVLSNTVGGGTERTNATDDNSVSTPALAARDAGGDDGSASTRAAAGPADSDVPGRAEDGWLAHRTLIRASLPRSENDVPEPRPIPEFTMYQRPQPRGRSFRFGNPHRPFGHSHGHGNGNGNGNGEANGNVGGNGNGSRPARDDGRSGQPSGRRRRRRRSR